MDRFSNYFFSTDYSVFINLYVVKMLLQNREFSYLVAKPVRTSPFMNYKFTYNESSVYNTSPHMFKIKI